MMGNKILYAIIVALLIVLILYFVINKGKKTKTDQKIINEDLSKNLYVSKSNIEGEGLFTDIDIENGKYITEVGDIDKWRKGIEFRTEFCKKVNHQLNGNTKVGQVLDRLYLVAIRDIKKGEELTTNYKVLPQYFSRKINNYIEIN